MSQPTMNDPTIRYAGDTAAAPAGPRRRRRTVLVAGVSALALAGAGFAAGYANRTQTINGSGTLAQSTPVLPRWDGGSGGSDGSGSSGDSGPGSGFGYGEDQLPGSGSGGGSSSDPGTGSDSGTASATTAQQVGVVDITTVLGYQNGAAAGTGTVMSSNGEILTNNHVVNGATKITVTVVSTGKSYSANVVGTDPSEDVAVLKLVDASGLKTANYDTTAAVAVGDAVVGVGNAGGAGGVPSAASGEVTALNQPITATDENGSNSESLTGLIETNAPIAAGDSGGPLYDDDDEVIGMDTAAQTTGTGQTAAGYAITITHALDIARQIESATASTSTIHLGQPAFLGVSVAATATVPGAGIEQVVPDGPAAQAGIVAGDVITAVGQSSINSFAQLQSALAQYKPGQSVSLTWTDGAGQTQHAKITLATGPVD